MDRAGTQALRSIRDIAVLAVPLVIVLIAAGLALEVIAPLVDEDVLRRVAGLGGRSGEVVSLVLARVGDVPGAGAVVVVSLVVARRRGRWRDLSFVTVAETVELVLFLLTSALVGRERPTVASPDAAPWTSAVPSSHVAIVVATGGAAALLVAAGRTRNTLFAGVAVKAVLVGG